jgi:nitrate reductase alpha subunit
VARTVNPLLRNLQYFRRGEKRSGGHSELNARDRQWEYAYRQRWQHDKVVRSTHGVNCTGSCSWKVYVKDGIITWESQQTDYPSNGPDSPEYEPRGCPRGASFSWYTYSPIRIKYPYVRGVLVEMYREAKEQVGDPVEAWAAVVEDPEKSRRYKAARGKGGLVRSTWPEVAEIMAAAHVYTIKKYGPDRIVGFSPIPAMSMASYSGGSRFMSLIGGTIPSFYDWYADLPPSSPQIWGDQTDVPESADWYNASYLMMWGSNVPITRAPDAHFMTEARYKGQKTVVVSPDYSDHTKFADHWLPIQPGTDGALAMAMGHVILKEFYVDRQVPYFQQYARKYTDLPMLVTLRERGGAEGGAYVSDRFLHAADLGEGSENAEWKTVFVDARTGEPAVPNGSMGFKYGEEGAGRWNLELGDADPLLTLLGAHDELVELDLPRFDVGDTDEGGAVMRRGVPARRIGEHLVTTVYDLMLAQYGVRRDALPGEWPASYDDPEPYTPAWQEEITGVDAGRVRRIAREFARNAERSEGRSMIIMGAGTNHWYHSDEIYRSMLALVLLCGCQGKNGGGWAHYVGQEKVRPITGWTTIAFAFDWARPTRHMAGTALWYLASSQWRYDTFKADEFASPLGKGLLSGKHLADCLAMSARLGWLPSFPSFNRNPLEITAEAEREGIDVRDYVVRELKEGRLRFAAEDPDAPENFPRVLTLWRCNLLGSSSKGHEFFLKHLLGVPDAAVRADESPEEMRPEEVVWRDAPEGKLDLLTTIDFRKNGSSLYSDIVLPTATWYEKHDISSTDMHPFIHPFNPAITPPWEAKSDWDIFNYVADVFSGLARTHLGVRKDVLAVPLMHDTPDDLAQPGGKVLDWKKGECEPVPGKTMPKLVVIERDYGAVAEKMRALGPAVENVGITAKGNLWKPAQEVDYLKRRNGTVRRGVGAGRPQLERAEQVCEAILALSGTTNGRLSVEGFTQLEKRTGMKLADLAEERGEELITFADITSQPRKVIVSPEWSGTESRTRRYSPFTINVDRQIPWRTLTGRQQFYVDHEWMLEYGEGLPAYRPPMRMAKHTGDIRSGEPGKAEVVLKYLTPHSKWSIHSEFQDNLIMLTLFRGGPTMWISPQDAAKMGVKDNDWIEAFNRNGVVAARAVVSHRIPEGTTIMYHSQDRHLNTPISEVSGTRGGTENSLTKIFVKPTHMIGGYAQFSYGFNYYGPTGSQRDELTVMRKRESEVVY